MRDWLKRAAVHGMLTLAVLLPAIAAPAEDDLQPLTAIATAARAFLVQQAAAGFPRAEISISDLDPRLKLAACDAPLNAFLPPGRQPWGNTTVGVRCGGRKPWTVYVPALVKGMRPVVVVKRPLPRGAVVGAGDLALEEREVTDRPDSYMFDPAQVVGMIAKRGVAAGTALSVTMLDAPLLVRRGQQITLLAETAGIEVRMAGTALNDGAEGQLVHAKNTASKHIVEGLVIKPGVIRVTM